MPRQRLRGRRRGQRGKGDTDATNAAADHPPAEGFKRVRLKRITPSHLSDGHRVRDERSIFLGRIPEEVESKEDVRTVLGDLFGEVTHVHIEMGRKFGFVHFESQESAQAALDAGTVELAGVPVDIRVATSNGRREDNGRQPGHGEVADEAFEEDDDFDQYEEIVVEATGDNVDFVDEPIDDFADDLGEEIDAEADEFTNSLPQEEDVAGIDEEAPDADYLEMENEFLDGGLDESGYLDDTGEGGADELPLDEDTSLDPGEPGEASGQGQILEKAEIIRQVAVDALKGNGKMMLHNLGSIPEISQAKREMPKGKSLLVLFQDMRETFKLKSQGEGMFEVTLHSGEVKPLSRKARSRLLREPDGKQAKRRKGENEWTDGWKERDEHTIWLGPIPEGARSKHDVADGCLMVGPVVHVHVQPDRKFGFVWFRHPEDAHRAMAAGHVMICNRKVTVRSAIGGRGAGNPKRPPPPPSAAGTGRRERKRGGRGINGPKELARPPPASHGKGQRRSWQPQGPAGRMALPPPVPEPMGPPPVGRSRPRPTMAPYLAEAPRSPAARSGRFDAFRGGRPELAMEPPRKQSRLHSPPRGPPRRFR